MWFYAVMFICNLLIPLIMLVGGYWMYKFPPKKINWVAGYRTSMARKNIDTWRFAHDYCGGLWIKVGLGLLVLSIAVQIPFAHSGDDVVGTMTLILEAAQIAVLLGSIVPAEKALKRIFDENGNRRCDS